MKFTLDGLEVFFPYDRIYLEQFQYMRALKQTLDGIDEQGGNSHCLLEMPTGTGKTVCLLSLITSYQYAHPKAGKLIYCTRTVPEMNHVMEELAVVLNYRAEMENDSSFTQVETVESSSNPNNNVMDIEDMGGKMNKQNTNSTVEDNENQDESNHHKKRKRRRVVVNNNKNKKPPMGPILENGGAGGSGVLALCLSSRRNMCIHDRVIQESDREAVDAACRSMTASWVLERAAKQQQQHTDSSDNTIETCPFYDSFHAAGESTSLPSGVYDLDQLKQWGRKQGWCPYYLTRQAINHANILVFNYQYMLDPKVAKMVSKELEAESIIVFDEAHNIDSVCIEALSVTINERGLEQATRSLGRLSSEISRLKVTDSQRLQSEYQNLLNGLIDQGLLNTSANDASLTSVSKPSNILTKHIYTCIFIFEFI